MSSNVTSWWTIVLTWFPWTLCYHNGIALTRGFWLGGSSPLSLSKFTAFIHGRIEVDYSVVSFGTHPSMSVPGLSVAATCHTEAWHTDAGECNTTNHSSQHLTMVNAYNHGWIVSLTSDVPSQMMAKFLQRVVYGCAGLFVVVLMCMLMFYRDMQCAVDTSVLILNHMVSHISLE